ARTYLLVSAAALLVTAAGLYFLRNELVATALVFVFGVGGLGLRWTSGPPAVVVILCWTTFFPLVLPLSPPNSHQIVGRQAEFAFLFPDLLLTASALTYLIATYRFHAVMRAGMPFDAPKDFIKPKARPTVRPAVPVRDSELWFLFARVGAAVLAGQLLWRLVTKLKVDFRRPFPVRFFNSLTEEAGVLTDDEMLPNALSRFLLAAGVILSATFGLWLVFWYWRLSVMNRDEARAACLDMEWATARREFNRPEKWRGWMRKKTAGTLPKKGCGAWFLVIGLPLTLIVLVLIVFGCMGALR
ncbi:MAG: hypothetical protein MUF18_11255, partial [Fimbriiglobus sp.]|nr:hypothetical protein [Fimbriiglobus sp.]